MNLRSAVLSFLVSATAETAAGDFGFARAESENTVFDESILTVYVVPPKYRNSLVSKMGQNVLPKVLSNCAPPNECIDTSSIIPLYKIYLYGTTI